MASAQPVKTSKKKVIQGGKKMDKEAISELILSKLIDKFGQPKNNDKLKSMKNIFAPPAKFDKISRDKSVKTSGSYASSAAAKEHDHDEKVSDAISKDGGIGVSGGGGSACTWPDQTVYPTDIADLKLKIEAAASAGKQIRIIGSNHSPEFTIFNQASIESGETELLCLDNLKGITIGTADASGDVLVTVESGIILGSRSTDLPTDGNNYGWDDGICMQLDNAGLSLTDLGGIVHQAAGGFVSMGCAGGTIMHDFNETIESIDMITLDSDNKCEVKTYPRPSDENDTDDEFWGVVTSMGLCGVITSITFKLNTVTNAKYNIVGSQTARAMIQWGLPSSLFGGGDTSQSPRDNVGVINFHAENNDTSNSLYSKLVDMKNQQTEYMRFFWAPQSGLNWIQMWKGHKETVADTTDPTYIDRGIYAANSDFIGKDYEQAGIVAQEIAWAYYNILDLFGFEAGTADGYECVKLTMELFLFIFMMSSSDAGITSGEPDATVLYFGHYWYRTLCMDTTIVDNYMPFQFTEVWCDLEDTTKAINICHSWFEQDQYFSNTGTFPWEFYCAKKDFAWMRPNYDLDCFRIDILWFDLVDPDEDPYDFYLRFWTHCVTSGLKCRPHWGKYCPHGNETFPQLSGDVLAEWDRSEQFETWLDYYKWILKDASGNGLIDKFTALMHKNDPNGRFRTPYWDSMLNTSN